MRPANWTTYAVRAPAVRTPDYCGGGGGSGGTGGGGSGGGTDGESCGESYSVVDATVEYMGETCSFTGTVNPTMIDGVCTDVAGEGVINCAGDGVSIEIDDEEEVETPDL